MDEIKNLIADVPDWPKKGVIFRDISPLLADPEWFKIALARMVDEVDLDNIDYIVGIESRGFILGSALSAMYGKGFIPIRKKGKLPWPVVSEDYELEYGTDTLEIKQMTGEKKSCLLVDDVLATGGTLGAALNLCRKAGYDVRDVTVLIDLTFLNDFTYETDRYMNLERKAFSVIKY